MESVKVVNNKLQTPKKIHSTLLNDNATIAKEASSADSIADAQHDMHIPYILNGELYKIKSQHGENVTVKCCHCPPDRVYRGSIRSTGNFHMHIKRRHPDLLGKLHNMKVNALLERRDKIMKNRNCKIHAGACGTGTKKSTGNLEDTSPVTTPMKIKRVFQRHQQQQAEAAIKKVDVTIPSIAMPEKFSHNREQIEPLDLSFKSNSPIIDNRAQVNQVEVMQQTLAPNYRHPSPSSVISITDDIPVTNSMELSTPAHLPDALPNFETIVLNSNNKDKHVHVNKFGKNSMGIIKNDQHQASPVIDLSSPTLPSAVGPVDMLTPRGPLGPNMNINGELVHKKWFELFQHAKSMVFGYENEMRARNQIEMNRLMLDLAKFKYTHPDFNFQFPGFK